MSARLLLVGSTGFKRLAERERLIARAAQLFPDEPARAAKWVEAKLRLGDAVPRTPIGTNQPAIFPRTEREAKKCG